MADSLIARIKSAEQAAQELIKLADEIRKKVEGTNDQALRKELLEIAERFEAEARNLADNLRRWKEDIH